MTDALRYGVRRQSGARGHNSPSMSHAMGRFGSPRFRTGEGGLSSALRPQSR
jgi:hypothetical protein